jgi:hypothetical protein
MNLTILKISHFASMLILLQVKEDGKNVGKKILLETNFRLTKPKKMILPLKIFRSCFW